MSNLFNKPFFALDDNFKIDNSGSLIEGARLNIDKAYSTIPDLLQDYIDKNNEQSWDKVKISIDYIYDCIFIMLKDLDENTHFMDHIKEDIKKNKLLLFKPNILAPDCISVTTHNKGSAYYLCTQWTIVAAIMRWFHDYGNIHYSHMALVEGCVDVYSLLYSKAFGFNITNEAIVEGRYGDLYGGWGFYFVRKYLEAYRTLDIDDNPMNGFEESCSGSYIPPGKATNKMMFYDTNQIQIDPSRGRVISVPDGKNFKEITLHKVIVGGDPKNTEDLKLYPGSILINIPVMKIHAQDMLTNSIKNIGIGLYPSKCAESQNPLDKNWLYSSPYNALPNTRTKLPHSPWILKIDPETGIPIKDKNGNYISKKTLGFSGTQLDIIKALQNENVFMVHISDNINIINISHTDGSIAKAIPEGFIWASLDCVALDLFCSRYCFKNIPMALGKYLQKKYQWSTEFVRKLPAAKVKNGQIITSSCFDSPLFRYTLFKEAENRGIGLCNYHVRGLDWTTGNLLSSYNGHLIRLYKNSFYELITKTLYYNPVTVLYNLQETLLSYLRCCDKLFHTNLYRETMNMFDENKDGIIDYNEKGRGYETAQLEIMANNLNMQISIDNGLLKGPFYQNATILRYSNSCWNEETHDYMKERIFIGKLAYAFQLSQEAKETKDLFYPNLIYGNGKWPSFKTAEYLFTVNYIYGGYSIDSIGEGSLYDLAFQYYDITRNSSYYTKNKTHKQALLDYFKALSDGATSLNFIFYVPHGFDKLNSIPVPNVVETTNPKLILTAHFDEIW